MAEGNIEAAVDDAHAYVAPLPREAELGGAARATNTSCSHRVNENSAIRFVLPVRH